MSQLSHVQKAEEKVADMWKRAKAAEAKKVSVCGLEPPHMLSQWACSLPA
jgi:hypothetical protein